MDPVLQALRVELASIIVRRILPCFKDQSNTRVTIIVRHEHSTEKDILIGDDTLDELTKVIERSRARENVGTQPITILPKG